MLTQSELSRYARHLNLPDFGIEAQEKLKNGRVLIIGAGGLGCPMLQYLAAAGVGHIGIIDPDRVSESNLQRQILYTMADIGRFKVEAAAERLAALNPFVHITTYKTALTVDNALDIIINYDVIADGTDNFATRYLVNDACLLAQKPLVYGAIFRFEGQVSVFNQPHNTVRPVNYRDLYPTPPPPHLVPDCADGGVLGVLPGIIGSIQANEVLKILTGVGQTLAGRLFLFDAQSFTTKVLSLPLDPDYKPINKLINYEQFCGFNTANDLQYIDVFELKKWLDSGTDCCLVDVRQPIEFEAGHLSDLNLPLSMLSENIQKLPQHKPIILYCKSGLRSEKAAYLLKNKGFNSIFTLKGGLQDWIKHIDDSLYLI